MVRRRRADVERRWRADTICWPAAFMSWVTVRFRWGFFSVFYWASTLVRHAWVNGCGLFVYHVGEGKRQTLMRYLCQGEDGEWCDSKVPKLGWQLLGLIHVSENPSLSHSLQPVLAEVSATYQLMRRKRRWWTRKVWCKGCGTECCYTNNRGGENHKGVRELW